jgi:hypothetical protein
VAQLGGERGELGDLAFGVGELGGDEVVEPLLDRPAALAVPDADEVSDLFQRAAELLSAPDERQAGERHLVIEPVSGIHARGR